MAKKRVTNFKYVPTPEEMEAMSICNDNGLRIFPLPQDNYGSRLKLHIYGDGYDQVGTQEYDGTKDVWYRAIYNRYVNLKEKENYVKKESESK